MNDRPSDTLRTARLVVGLGNPGAEYADTRHNVGFRVLDHLADELGLLFRGPSALQVPNASPGNGGSSGPGFGGFQWARTDGEPFGWLLQPLTYMNRSGEVVAPFARWLARHGALPALPMEEPIEGDADAEPDAPPRKRKKAPRVEPDPAQILVVYDDMDLEPGQLRLRPHGGHGGQNGMRDIIDRLRTDRFPRLRVGIGRAGTDAARHVLGRFTPAEEEIVGVSIAEASEAARAFLEGEDFSGLMTRFHSRWKGSG